MTRLPPSPPNPLETLKLYSSAKKVISQSFETKVSEAQEEVLSRLLTTTFIARQLGLKVSLKVSGKEL